LFDPDLVGVWESVEKEEKNFLDWPSITNWKILDFDEEDQKFFELLTTSFNGSKGVYQARMVKIGETKFLDLFPGGHPDLLTEDEESILEPILNNYYWIHFKPLHTFLRIETKMDSLELSVLDPHWLDVYIKEHPEEVRHQFLGPNDAIESFVFTDTPENMQKFLEKHIHTIGVFTDHVTFRRKSRISRNRVKNKYFKIKVISEANAILEEYPNEIEIYRARARLLIKDGRYDEALADFNRVMESDPSNLHDYIERAKIYLEKSDYMPAVSDLKRAFEMEPLITWYEVQLKEGEYDRFIGDYSRMIELEPKYIPFYKVRANAYEKRGKYNLAIADYSKLIELEPSDTIFYQMRAGVYLKMGEYDKAVADHGKTIELEPTGIDNYHRRVDVYLKTDQYDQAIADYNKLIELEPSDTNFFRRAAVYVKLGDYERAVSDYRRAVDSIQAGSYDNFYINNIIYTLKREEYDRAITDFSKLIELDPSNPIFYQWRGFINFNKGQYDLAAADYSKKIELEPSNTWSYYIRSKAYLKMGEYDQAIDDLDKVIVLAPKMPGAYNYKAWILATSPEAKYRDGAKAFELAGKALKLDNSNYNYWDTLAAAYAEMGRFEEAVTTQEMAISLFIKITAEQSSEKDELEKHLEAFKANKPWRE
jgi:tetratricopeptide (TPR) repeat protein